jgi:hypothetical protein
MYLSNETKKYQEKLARYCRTGDLNEIKEIPGIRTDRVKQYRRLIFNVFESTLRQAYPITYQLLDEDIWEQFVSDFLSQYDAKSNKVWLLASEFYQFAAENNYHEKLQIPFLLDLLLFEWIEIEVFTMEDAEMPAGKSEGDLLDDVLIFTPEFQIINLEYPVHLFPVSQVEEHKGQYFILVFRHPESKEVKFMDLSPVFTMLISRMHSEELTAREILTEFNRKISLGTEDELIQNTLPFLNDLTAQGFVIGFKEKGD